MGCTSSSGSAVVAPMPRKSAEAAVVAEKGAMVLAPAGDPTRWRPAPPAPSSRVSTTLPGDASSRPSPSSTAASSSSPSSSSSSESSGDEGALVADRVGRVQDHYKLMHKLGCGAIGSVRKAVQHRTGMTCAVKCMYTEAVYDRGLEREAEIMASFAHPNLLRFHECYQDIERTYLVLEMCEGGDLMDRMADDSVFTERNAAIVMQQVFDGVAHMHERGIVHRDLKPDNFLFERRGPIEGNVLKIADFGIACEVQPGERLTERIGTLQYMAPEVFRRDYDQACDLWSCGVVFYLMLRGAMPFNGGSPQEIRRKITRGKPSLTGKRWAQTSEDAKCLLAQLLQLQPEVRPTAAAAAQAPVLRRLAPELFVAEALEVDVVEPFMDEVDDAAPPAPAVQAPPRPASREAWLDAAASPCAGACVEAGASRASSKCIRRMPFFASRGSRATSKSSAASARRPAEEGGACVERCVPAPFDAGAWAAPVEPEMCLGSCRDLPPLGTACDADMFGLGGLASRRKGPEMRGSSEESLPGMVFEQDVSLFDCCAELEDVPWYNA